MTGQRPPSWMSVILSLDIPVWTEHMSFFLDISVDSEHFEYVGELRRKHREGDISSLIYNNNNDNNSHLSLSLY